MNAQVLISVNCYIFGQLSRSGIACSLSLPKIEIEGEEDFPIQVHSACVIFIAATVIFIFSTASHIAGVMPLTIKPLNNNYL